MMSILLNEVEYVYGKGTVFEKVALYDVLSLIHI